MKLLILMPSKYLGNTVIAMRAIADTLTHYRADNVTLLVDETFEELSKLTFPGGHRLLTYPRRAPEAASILEKAGRYIRFVSGLRQTAYDCAIDIDGTVISGRIMRLVRAKRKIGPDFAKRAGAYTRLVPIDRDSHHCFDDFRLMVEAIDVEISDPDYLPLPRIPTRYKDDAALGQPLDKLLASGPLACIHPCATKDYKQWDINKFAELADTLMDAGWNVVLLGAGEGERPRVEAMLAAMHHTPLNAHGRLGLVPLIYLLQQATVFVGNDSGPMHLAAASGIYVIALFGPTELLRWQPRAPRVQVIKGLEPCSPQCKVEDCLYAYRCLGSLTVAQVLGAIEQVAPVRS